MSAHDTSQGVQTEPPFVHPSDQGSIQDRLRHFMTPLDGRYEDLLQGAWRLNLLRDFTAGLIVAMVAIPLAMGLAMASGLRPEQGIVGGAVAGLVGALFGGSKYQVYGPTAAFIPVISGIMAAYNYQFLVVASLLAGVVLMLAGVFRWGRIISLVPNSIVVGFTIGIAVVIAMSQLEQVLGLKSKIPYEFLAKVRGVWEHRDEFNFAALTVAAVTLGCTWGLLKISRYIPAPLIAVAVATVIGATLLADQGLVVVKDKYGAIPRNLLVFTLPQPIDLTPKVLFDLVYFTVAIVFVSGIESLLCSRMADRLANNRGIPFNPNKELWGQGWVQALVVLVNGFPHTGALARTATNIKVGAVSPLAGIFKFALKLVLAYFLAGYLEQVPMACIGGILLFVALNMVKPSEVREVVADGRFHTGLMAYTAVMVPLTDFLVGVLSALAIYGVLYRFVERSTTRAASATATGTG